MPDLTWWTAPYETARAVAAEPVTTADREAVTAAEPESMEQLLGDCARIIPHWTDHAGGLLHGWAGRPAPPPAVPAASYEALSGVRVPAASARVLEGMSEYGVW